MPGKVITASVTKLGGVDDRLSGLEIRDLEGTRGVSRAF